MSRIKTIVATALAVLTLSGCDQFQDQVESIDFEAEFPQLFAAFSSNLDFNNLPDYASQVVPSYITRDNTNGNNITNSAALLGRVLFYDVNLSSTNTTSCASCHIQARAFGDINTVSVGANGLTGRHSTRLVNAGFGDEDNFFWDERANSLEDQTTQPIRDHNEMGFSGTSGAPDFDDLIVKLSAIGYYQDLFTYAFGDAQVTEARMQIAMAQFIRSIQSFDSKYDQGRVLVANDNMDFPNFTTDENAGKRLFMQNRGAGGANCAVCHQPPEFSIRANSENNGLITAFGGGIDTTVTRSPTLRDLVDVGGNLNGPLMHDGSLTTLEAVVEFYDSGVVDNANLDSRLQNGGGAQNLGLTTTEKAQLVLFLKTLGGRDVYTNPKWSSPF